MIPLHNIIFIFCDSTILLDALLYIAHFMIMKIVIYFLGPVKTVWRFSIQFSIEELLWYNSVSLLNIQKVQDPS